MERDTYAGDVCCDGLNLLFLKGPIRETGEDVLRMEALEGGNLGEVTKGRGTRGGTGRTLLLGVVEDLMDLVCEVHPGGVSESEEGEKRRTILGAGARGVRCGQG